MKIYEIISEGGWDVEATQDTTITPDTIKKAIAASQKLISQFNDWLKTNHPQYPPVEVGHPTGSSAYYQVDPPDQEYGDVDLQIIVPDVPEFEDLTFGQKQSRWVSLLEQFLSEANPSYVHPDSKRGHPVLEVAPNEWVQVDMMPHPTSMSHWARWRVTPERGIKGLLTGNVFSVLGSLLDMSIQHGGVQLKTRDGERVPYSQRKDTQVHTISTSPESFIMDIFNYEAEQAGVTDAEPHPELVSNPGLDVPNVRISDLISGVKGLAKSFEANEMFGEGSLQNYNSAEDFISAFRNEYVRKAETEIKSPKRQKAETPAAKERAQKDIEKIQKGLDKIMKLL